MRISLIVVACSLLLSCSKSDPAPAPSITTFSPTSGPIASTVTLNGVNFSSTPANNDVKFNGAKAEVTASTGSTITVKVPNTATSGIITVTVGGQSAVSASPFTINPLMGVWRFTGTTASNCANAAEDGATTCTADCPTLTFTASTVAYAFTGGVFDFTYTLSGNTLTISSPGGSFSPTYVLSGSQLTLVYPPDECSVTETYVKL